MFSTHGKQSITLDNFGGLITEAPPESLPEGASPLTYDCDFLVAAVTTRAGLQSVLNAGVGRNFVWAKTMRTNDGTLRTLCLDASGQLWVENVTASPGTLTAVKTFTNGDYCLSSTAFNREYLSLCDPAGLNYDIPWQFDGTNFDRISQEGPGGSPSFAPPANNPQSATITSFSITSNVVTFQAVNTFAAGQIVSPSGMGIGTYLNGQVLTVLVAGLSGTQFEANFTHANVSSTNDSGTVIPVTSFAISGIAQPVPVTATGAIQWSSGPDQKTAGNVITLYYSHVAQDPLLAAQFQKGLAVYVTIGGTPPAPWSTGTFQVTSIGSSPGGGGPWYFLTWQAPNANTALLSGNGHTTTYQITLATVTTTTPVPGLAIGGQASIQGATPTGWNNTWSVVDTPQGGFLSVTQTSLTGGVASYAFTLSSGNNPVAGDLVTVNNTTNGNGAFNVINATIATVVGSTFTINFAGAQTPANIAAQPETGSAQTFGRIFSIDPGALYAGLSNATSPIFGNDSGTGTIVALGTTLNIGSGTRQAVVMFLTRNGYLTKPSPPITFVTTGLQQSITVSNLPIGPPNVIARWVAFTEAGANGVPGAFFYVIPTPVQSIVNGQPFTYSSTVVPDNTTTSATFTFTDAVLLTSTEIDVPGNDLFSLRELGNCRWNIQYANRMFYGLEQNKITNFVNLTFNGGYYASDGPFPLGWTQDPTNGPGGSLITSSIGTGQSYYIQNLTGSTQALYGMITQPAFEDAFGVPIIQPNTAYGARIHAKIPSGLTGGNLVVEFIGYDSKTGYGISYGKGTVPFSSLNSASMTWVTLNPFLPVFATVPSNLVLRIYATSIVNGADVELDRTEYFPITQPVNSAQVAASYINNPESIDNVTGSLGLAQRNNQPANGAFVMYDQMYLLKTASMFVTRDSASDEPYLWDIHEVSNRVGTVSIHSYDVGEEWMATACREGVFVFTGGSPVKISQEIQQAWDLINWSAAYSIWLRYDIQNRRILIGAPMATPNPYLPNAPVNANPTTPNVVFMLNYVGLNSPHELADAPQMHTTMFGNLVSVEMRRKWNIWQIAAPNANFIVRQDQVSKPLFLCNGTASGKIYQLNPLQFSDDGAIINSLYTTYGFVNSGMTKQNPLLGFHRKLFTYLQMLAYGVGTMAVKFLSNNLNANANFTWSVLSSAGGITLQSNPSDDIERSINVAGNRVYAQFSTNAVGAHFTISKVIMVGGPHPMVPLRGSASA